MTGLTAQHLAATGQISSVMWTYSTEGWACPVNGHWINSRRTNIRTWRRLETAMISMAQNLNFKHAFVELHELLRQHNQEPTPQLSLEVEST